MDNRNEQEIIERLREFPLRAPTLIVVSAPYTESRISAWEQQLSAGAAGQNLLLAAVSLGFAAQWLTRPAAYSRGVHAFPEMAEHDRIAGFPFIGSPSDTPLAERPRPGLAKVVSWR